MGCLHSKEKNIYDEGGGRGGKEDFPVALGATARLSRLSSARQTKERKKKPKTTNNSCSDSNSDRNKQVALNLPKLDENGRLTRNEVEYRRSIPDTSTIVDIGSGVQLNYAYCTQRGYYPDDPHKNNQDDLCIVPNHGGEEKDIFLGVLDGHGADGHHCAKYVKDNLPKLLTTYIRQERAKKFKLINDNRPSGRLPFNYKLFPMLEKEQYQKATRNAHIECNSKMLESMKSVNLSGTTSISAGFHDGMFTISNVGDSRAVLGYRYKMNGWKSNGEGKGETSNTGQGNNCGKLVAIPLSRDQTPWRREERERIRAAGGRIMTIDQMEGREALYKNDDNDGFGDRQEDLVDIEGDPPRVWLETENIPGTSFSRSFGDKIAQAVGVNAEPEMFTKAITEEDEVLVLASDGVFEFLTNQQVIDICGQSKGPIDASRNIVEESYAKWLHYEHRTDDITVIVIVLDHNSILLTK